MVRKLICAIVLLIAPPVAAQEVTYPAGTPGVQVFSTNGREVEEIERAFRALEAQYEHGASIRDFVIGYTKVPDHPPTIAFMRIPEAIEGPEGSVRIGTPGRFYQVVVDGDDVAVIPRD